VATGAKRSRTAQGVAAERALLADMGVVPDPYARQMLSPSTAAIFEFVRRWPAGLRTRSVTMAGLAGRILWFDGQMNAALDAGVTQVAVVGAGYDSRAWRMQRDGVRYFELDHPATQQDKLRRAPGPGPMYVAVDLTSESAADALLASGFDNSQPALFVVEGLTMYLREEVVRRQLREIATTTASGSRLTVNFQPPRDTLSQVHRRQARLQTLARAGSGETFRLLVDPAQAVALVDESGWEVTEATSTRDAARALVPPSSGLRVEAVNPAMTLVAGSRV
jgi:methyltransferase (TIGR00027 family)